LLKSYDQITKNKRRDIRIFKTYNILIGWFGMGFGKSMADADMIIVQINNN